MELNTWVAIYLTILIFVLVGMGLIPELIEKSKGKSVNPSAQNAEDDSSKES